MNHNPRVKGFTLLEIILYFAIFGLILGSIVKIEIQTIGAYNRNHYREKVVRAMMRSSYNLRDKLDKATEVNLRQTVYDNENYQILEIFKPSAVSNYDSGRSIPIEKYTIRFNLNQKTIEICRGDFVNTCLMDGTAGEWFPFLDENVQAAFNAQTAVKICDGGDNDGKECSENSDCNNNKYCNKNKCKIRGVCFGGNQEGNFCVKDSDCVGGGHCDYPIVEEDKIGPCLAAEGSEISYCGDGSDDSGEECDDGNNISGDGCGATCGDESIVNHDFNNESEYIITERESGSVEFADGNVGLKDLGGAVYSTKKPYVKLSSPVGLIDPTNLDKIEEIDATNVEYSVEINGNDKWWNETGSSWEDNSGELREGDDLYDSVNLISVWHLDETEGAGCAGEKDICDFKNSNHGTNNGATYGTNGKLNNALSFDGTDDYVNIGDADSEIKTISFWINADDTTSRKIIDINGTDQIEIDDSSNILATNFPGTTVIYVDGSAATAITTDWHHIVITDTTGVDASAMDIGRVSTGYFDGKIDEVAIWNIALSETDILRLYADQNNNKHSNTLAAMNANLSALSVSNGDAVTLLTYLISDGGQQAEIDNAALSYLPEKPPQCGDKTCESNSAKADDLNTCVKQVKEIKLHLQLENNLDSTSPWYYSLPAEMRFTIPYYD